MAALELVAPLGAEDAEAYFPLAELAKLLAQAGDSRSALAAADAMSHSLLRVNLLAELAAVQAQDKQPEAARAIEAGRRAPNDAIWESGSAPGDIEPMLPIQKAVAEAQAKVGDLDAALKTFAEMGHSQYAQYMREQAVQEIVKTLLDAGDVQGALRAVGALPEPQSDSMFQDERGDMLERVARQQARRHDPATALEWARKQKTVTAKPKVLRGLADGIAERFEPEKNPAKPGAPPSRPQPGRAGP